MEQGGDVYCMKYYEIKGLGLSFSVACARPEMKKRNKGQNACTSTVP